MKKAFIIFALLLCGSLFAEEFTTNDSLYFLIEETSYYGDFEQFLISAVLPYENGFVVKLSNKNKTLELYITKGFVFYEWCGFDSEYIHRLFKQHTITEVLPNKIITKSNVYYSN